MANALTNVGIGAAVETGMSAIAKVAKGASLPVVAKLGMVIAGGVGAGVITIGVSAAIKITDSKITDNTSTSSTNSNFPAKCCIDNLDLNYITCLLTCHYILSIIISYLVVNILTLYITDLAIKNNWKFRTVKLYTGENFYKYFILAIRFNSKSNKVFLIVSWMILFICCLGNTYFSYFILNNIYTISSVLKPN